MITGSHSFQRPSHSAHSLRAALRLAATAAAAFSISLTAPAQPKPGGDGRYGGSGAAANTAQSQPRPFDLPEVSEAVTQLLSASYLTPAEQSDQRVFHGQWRAADLNTPARMARAALLVGAWDDPSLTSTDADPLDRAEAALRRGEAESAITLTSDSTDARAIRIRADALIALGRSDEALAIAEDLLTRVVKGQSKSPAEIVEGVKLLALRAQIKGPEGPSGADFHSMMTILGSVRTALDRLYWPAHLAEAELLQEKDNPAQAQEALDQALKLNPACAEAWVLLGRLAVDSFDFNAADRIAARLDALARDAGTGIVHDDNEPEPDAAAQAPSTDAEHPSADASLLRARAALRLNDPDAALASIDAVLRTHPKMREALALRAAACARRYDDAATAAALAAYDAATPNGPEALYEVGQTLSEARQYQEAARYLSQAHDRRPAWAAPVIELGLLYIQSGDDGAAGDALRTATRLDPFNKRAGNSLDLVKELASYQQVESDHYIVRYKPGTDGVLAREMLAPLERNYQIVTGKEAGGIDCQPPGKTAIDLMPNHQWFGIRIAGLPRIHTIAASTGPVIAMEAPREGKGHLGTYDWVRVVRHEFTHTVTLARTRNRIPHWFTEASAVYLEQSPRDFTTSRLLADALRTGSLFDFTKINVAFVRPEKPTDRALAYAQGHWMYEYIIERFGREAPLRLMDLYAQGVREEAAFQSVLGVSREQFLEQFKDWARDQVIAWGLAPAPGQPTLRELVQREADSAKDKPAVAATDDGASSTDPSPPAPHPIPGAGGRSGPKLPDVTREMVAAWLQQYPTLADAMQMAIDMDLEAAGGNPTAQMLPMLQSYAQVRPVDPMPHRLLAKYYLTLGGADAAKAIPDLEYLDAREQKSPTYASELARRYAAIGDWDHAALKAERATQIAPYEPAPRELAATVAIKRKDYDTAQRHLTALTELEPDRPVHKERLDALQKLRAAAPPPETH